MDNINSIINEKGLFSQKENKPSFELKELLIKGLNENEDLLIYDQYYLYHYKQPHNHKQYYIERIKKMFNVENGEWIFFYHLTHKGPYIIGLRISKWDEEHFGFKMANLQIFSAPKELNQNLNNIIVEAVTYAKNINVKYISSRVNGDWINALHNMENVGFRYYDNVVWPIASTKNINTETQVRLMKDHEVIEVKRIAENFQYQRGHYYCDDKFDKKIINSMYPKWIDTTVKNNEPIAVLERNSEIAGFFVFKIDQELQDYTGYKYGRLRLLALDEKYRGTGAGVELFNGTLSLIKSMGADFIDSGYSTKNHISAKLHVKSSFFSVYEEVTFHLWIN